VRALIVTNMYPSPERPALGSFVRDQVRALERIDSIELELFTFAPGSMASYLKAARSLRRRFGEREFDVVHAHFGLTGWPALAVRARAHVLTLHGTDLAHPRSRAITLAGLRAQQLVGAVSSELAATVPRWATRRGVAVLPCGVDTARFQPTPRTQARAELGLDPDRPYLLFPADPARSEKRYDLALSLARASGSSGPCGPSGPSSSSGPTGSAAELLVLRGVEPERVPLMVNAANAVIVPSDREGFGLAVLEALSCDVPVLATPHGIAPEVLAGVAGAYCGPFDLDTWGAALAPHLSGDPRIEGRQRAARYSADAMAARVVEAWRSLLAA
jgi:teichuronic acid biosynthesis glycosyltransferase TuaC